MDFSVPHATPQDSVTVDMCAFCFGNVSKQSGLGQGTHDGPLWFHPLENVLRWSYQVWNWLLQRQGICQDKLEPCPERGGWRLLGFSFKMSQCCHSLSVVDCKQTRLMFWCLFLFFHMKTEGEITASIKETILDQSLTCSDFDAFNSRNQNDLCMQRYWQDYVFVNLIKTKPCNSKWLKTLVSNKSFS